MSSPHIQTMNDLSNSLDLYWLWHLTFHSFPSLENISLGVYSFHFQKYISFMHSTPGPNCAELRKAAPTIVTRTWKRIPPKARSLSTTLKYDPSTVFRIHLFMWSLVPPFANFWTPRESHSSRLLFSTTIFLSHEPKHPQSTSQCLPRSLFRRKNVLLLPS